MLASRPESPPTAPCAVDRLAGCKSISGRTRFALTATCHAKGQETMGTMQWIAIGALVVLIIVYVIIKKKQQG